MAHIVILGAGIGGIPMAYEMKDLARPEDRVTVVSNVDHFHFVPSNPWVAVGWRKREDITIPLAGPLGRKGVDFRTVGCRRVVPEANALELNDGSRIEYDQLVIATGPELAFDEIEGFGPQANTISICHVDHAVEAARRWEAFCRDPGPLVIGAVQGASCFGPAYEFAMIVDADLRRRKIRHKVPITFVTSEPYVGHLGLDGVGDTKGLLESALRERHIKWIVNARTDRFEPAAVHVTEMGEDGQEKAKHVIDSRLTMMLPAFRGIGALRGVDGLVNPRGFVLTDKHQRNPTYRNIFGVGVCIAIPPVGKTPVPVGVPKTGYMIETMVTATAHNIRSLLDGREPTEEPTWNALCLADFGDSGVAFAAMPQIPPRNVNWSSHGRWVHLAKVGFERYFLRKVRKGVSAPMYERYVLKLLGMKRIQEAAVVADGV
ncbi:pyridine nucleotide-disulfide oxidoreductase [Azospirillum thermophilum]|uniref:Sulfide-quinone reductase n=2 Tax=Azospirillum thermophilum TaxID=2202148 RepID=A0A2S2CKM2_9PROT|nr:pyridine nucleotide-disulfide oxidoreductase [Azospirillum thermophilum]